MILRTLLLTAILSTSAMAAPNVTITRDDFGIPHIKGKTDADAVYGRMGLDLSD